MRRMHFWRTAPRMLYSDRCLGARAEAADVLKVVPNNVLGVVVINNVGQTDGKIQQLAGQLQLPQLGLLTKTKTDLGLEKGIDDTGCFALAAIPGGVGTAPVAVAYVPVDDYQAFVQQLNAEAPVDGISNIVAGGKPAAVAECGGYAVITERSHRGVLTAVLSLTESIAAQTPSLDDWRRHAGLRPRHARGRQVRADADSGWIGDRQSADRPASAAKPTGDRWNQRSTRNCSSIWIRRSPTVRLDCESKIMVIFTSSAERYWPMAA